MKKLLYVGIASFVLGSGLIYSSIKGINNLDRTRQGYRESKRIEEIDNSLREKENTLHNTKFSLDYFVDDNLFINGELIQEKIDLSKKLKTEKKDLTREKDSLCSSPEYQEWIKYSEPIRNANNKYINMLGVGCIIATFGGLLTIDRIRNKK
jgi:lipopolysaccharide assembly outer membrane protein LptD (OstA)